jgi:hypothetical protein
MKLFSLLPKRLAHLPCNSPKLFLTESHRIPRVMPRRIRGDAREERGLFTKPSELGFIPRLSRFFK